MFGTERLISSGFPPVGGGQYHTEPAHELEQFKQAQEDDINRGDEESV